MLSRDKIKTLKSAAKFIAMVVRNNMEDFHCEHLTDAQMKELNPIIRNAIYTALYAIEDDSESAAYVRKFHSRMIPAYWEDPELTESFQGVQSLLKSGA
jgi:hypothetical protein